MNGTTDIHDVACLAERLATSGAQLARRALPTADLASTGGPTSLSTILCPPMLAAAGWEVPKLGVPGRPAGGVDVLAGIDGYRVSLAAEDVAQVLDKCRYVHVEAGEIFAPADAALFHYRQTVGAQSVPDLAIASLLSKKLAMGVCRFGLEVRVAPHGNFGADLSSARAAAERLIEVAAALGVEAVCVLTEATSPFQPYVGRGEALVALNRVLDGTEDPWLGEHLADCAQMAAVVGGGAAGAVGRAELCEAFVANIEEQGGSVDALKVRANEVEAHHTRTIVAPAAGLVQYNLERMRSAVIAAQGAADGRKWPDEAGVVLLARSRDRVAAGDPLLTVRCPHTAWREMREAMAGAIQIGHAEEAPLSAILEVVGV